MKYFLTLDDAQKKQVDACFTLAHDFLTDFPEDFETLPHSKQAQIAFFLGEFYKRGQFNEIDEIKSFEFYQKAAQLRHPQAQYRLGQAYYEGEAVAQSDLLAVEWWCKSSFQRCQLASAALDNLEAKTAKPGALLEKGWWIKGAFAGHPEAKLLYGQACFFGNVDYAIPQNEEMAIAWWEKAVHEGNARAAYKLGDAYLRGRGVIKNVDKALAYYEQAANLGDILAKEKLFGVDWQYIIRKRGGGD